MSTINRAYETNNYSIISKYSASKAGYCKDEILEDFVENWLDKKSNSRGRRRTPLVNRGYAARMLAMDWAIDKAILLEKVNCFIVLGAGFDTTALRRTSQVDNNCHWIEIDLPQVIETKCAYIKSKWQLDDSQISSPSQGITSFLALKCHLISCDLTNEMDLHQKLSILLSTTLAFEALRNVCLVNEVCLCYLDEQVRVKIFHTITSTLSSFNTTKLNYIGFEQLKSGANSEMAQIMSSHFEKLGHPLKFFPTNKEMRAHYFGKCQFLALTILQMYQMYHNILQPKRAELKLDTLEPFDEFEEMDLYLSHYALVMGRIRLGYSDRRITGTGEDDESMSELCSKLASNVHIGNHQVRKVTNCGAVRRYGQAACVLEDTANVQVALLSGGFGDLLGMLTRLDDCQLVAQDNNQQTVRRIPFVGGDDSNPVGRSMYGQVCRLTSGTDNNVLLFFNGGRTSPLKRPNALNNSCICRLHEDELSYVTTFNPDTSLRWRHRIVKLGAEQVIQAGGISGLTSEQQRSPPLIAWNFSSDKLGQWQVPAIRDLEQFERHSFGMSTSESGHQLLVFGGLQSANEQVELDRPAHSALLYDLRNSSGAPELTLEQGTQVYGHQVHFINEHQFVRVGGVSSESGLPETSVDLFDLRAVGQHRVTSFEVPECADLPDNSQAPDEMWMSINLDSLKFENSGQIVSYGGGGNYFTFGTGFNSTRLVYSYARNSK